MTHAMAPPKNTGRNRPGFRRLAFGFIIAPLGLGITLALIKWDWEVILVAAIVGIPVSVIFGAPAHYLVRRYFGRVTLLSCCIGAATISLMIGAFFGFSPVLPIMPFPPRLYRWWEIITYTTDLRVLQLISATIFASYGAFVGLVFWYTTHVPWSRVDADLGRPPR